MPSTFRELKDNLKPFNIETWNHALGNFTGEAEIQVAPNLSELASTFENLEVALAWLTIPKWGLDFFDKYHCYMDDLIGQDDVMVNNERPEIKSFHE